MKAAIKWLVTHDITLRNRIMSKQDRLPSLRQIVAQIRARHVKMMVRRIREMVRTTMTSLRVEKSRETSPLCRHQDRLRVRISPQ